MWYYSQYIDGCQYEKILFPSSKTFLHSSGKFTGSLLHIGQLQGPQGVVLHEKAKRVAIPISIKKIQ